MIYSNLALKALKRLVLFVHFHPLSLMKTKHWILCSVGFKLERCVFHVFVAIKLVGYPIAIRCEVQSVPTFWKSNPKVIEKEKHCYKIASHGSNDDSSNTSNPPSSDRDSSN